MGLALRNPHETYTYGDYLKWPDEVRYELIDGAAYLMTGPLRRHQEVLGELFFQVRNALAGTPCRPYLAPFDVRLPIGDEADEFVKTVVQPDLSVICDRRKLDERGCRGAPDWVVEVLSPTTAGHDQTVKLGVYERAGVRELWFVHPTDHLVTIYTPGADGIYVRPAIYETLGETAVGVLPEVRIDWARVFFDPDAPAAEAPPDAR